MAMASSPLPVPAEVVIPPAAFLAAQGKLSFAGVIIAGTVGSYLGALLMYWISRWIGRPLVLRFGRFVLLSPKKLEEAEHWLARYEAGGQEALGALGSHRPAFAFRKSLAQKLKIRKRLHEADVAGTQLFTQ